MLKHTKLLACILRGCLPEDNTSALLTPDTLVTLSTASAFAMRQGWDIYMQGTKEFAQQCSKILLKQSKNGK